VRLKDAGDCTRGARLLLLLTHIRKEYCVMSKQTTSLDFVAGIPHAIEPHWDNVWARRLAGNEISAEAELSVDRSTKPRPRLVRPTSIYDSDGVGATSEPGVSPNLNVGRVPDPDSELLKKAQMVREKALSDGETHILLGTIFGG